MRIHMLISVPLAVCELKTNHSLIADSTAFSRKRFHSVCLGKRVLRTSTPTARDGQNHSTSATEVSIQEIQDHDLEKRAGDLFQRVVSWWAQHGLATLSGIPMRQFHASKLASVQKARKHFGMKRFARPLCNFCSQKSSHYLR